MADTMDGKSTGERIADSLKKLPDTVQGSQAWNSIFRPGSIFRNGYTDSPRNRSYVIMNSVLYHLHPVKVKRHAVKVSYTLCLGGLSFFLFILLTVTGIFLMFFYRPTAAQAWDDIYTLQTSVTFGLLVRNMHRWGAHLMVLSVFLHMARVFYHGAYKPPREFNWVIGVVLLLLTLLLSFTGYLLPWDQLALWAVTVGTNMMGYTPVFGNQVRFVLLGGAEIGTDTLLRWYVLHVLMLPFVIVIFMAIHFWRVRKDGGIIGPAVIEGGDDAMTEIPEHLRKRAEEARAKAAAASGASADAPADGRRRRARVRGREQDPRPPARALEGRQGQGRGWRGRRLHRGRHRRRRCRRRRRRHRRPAARHRARAGTRSASSRW